MSTSSNTRPWLPEMQDTKGVSIAYWKHTGFRFQGTMVQIPMWEKNLVQFYDDTQILDQNSDVLGTVF